jgi:hypothetical protein
MYITKHAIQRFRERITSENPEVVRFFIEQDVQNSELLYKVNNNIEKRISNGIVYVLDCKNQSNPKVVTLYLLKK